MGAKVQKTKHVPMRTCIATRKKTPKKELIRLAFDKELNKVIVDLRGKVRGRGANITPTMEAFDLAIKKRAINRALKLEQAMTTNEIEVLRIEFQQMIDEKAFRPDNKPVRIKVKSINK